MNTAAAQEKPVYYKAMAQTARDLIEKACFRKRITARSLAAQAGMDVALVESILHENMPVCLNGKEWERLVSTVGVSPQEWVMQSELLSEVKGSEDDVLLGTGSDLTIRGPGSSYPINDESDKLIRRVLRVMNDFFQQASKLWVEQHQEIDVAY